MHTFTLQLLDKPWSQIDVIPSSPRFLPSFFIAHRVQQSYCSSIVHRMLRTHALDLSASQFVHEKKSQRFYTSMHSAGLELTKLTYTRLEDNLIRHRGDQYPPLSTLVPSKYKGGRLRLWGVETECLLLVCQLTRLSMSTPSSTRPRSNTHRYQR